MAKLATGPQLGQSSAGLSTMTCSLGPWAWCHVPLRSWAWLEGPVPGVASGGRVGAFQGSGTAAVAQDGVWPQACSCHPGRGISKPRLQGQGGLPQGTASHLAHSGLGVDSPRFRACLRAERQHGLGPRLVSNPTCEATGPTDPTALHHSGSQPQVLQGPALKGPLAPPVLGERVVSPKMSTSSSPRTMTPPHGAKGAPRGG